MVLGISRSRLASHALRVLWAKTAAGPCKAKTCPSNHVAGDSGHLAAVGAERGPAHSAGNRTPARYTTRCAASLPLAQKPGNGIVSAVLAAVRGAAGRGQSANAGPQGLTLRESGARARCVTACTAAGLALSTGYLEPRPDAVARFSKLKRATATRRCIVCGYITSRINACRDTACFQSNTSPSFDSCTTDTDSHATNCASGAGCPRTWCATLPTRGVITTTQFATQRGRPQMQA